MTRADSSGAPMAISASRAMRPPAAMPILFSLRRSSDSRQKLRPGRSDRSATRSGASSILASVSSIMST